MQESKFYQRQREKTIRETTIKHILAVLNTKYSAEIVSAITPMIQNINDLQRLDDLHTAAAKAQNIETFTQMLNK